MSTAITVQPSALDVLKAAAKPAAKKSGSKSPVICRPDLQQKCSRFAEVVGQMKSLEAEKAMLGADLTAVSEQARIEESRKAGQCLTSVKLNNLTYVAQTRFSDVSDPEEVARLKALPGMDQYVEERVQIVFLDPTKLSPEWGAALVQLRDAGVVQITSVLRIKPAYLNDRTMQDNVAALHEQAQIKNVSFMRA